MHKFLEQARTGDWLTLARLRAYSFILLAITACALVAIIVTAKDRLMPNDNPVGADFAQVWVAGAEALRGAPTAPFDVPTHIAAQRVNSDRRPPSMAGTIRRISSFPPQRWRRSPISSR